MIGLYDRSAYLLYVLHKSLEASKIELTLAFDFQVDLFDLRSLLQSPNKDLEFFVGKESFLFSICFCKSPLDFVVSATQVQSTAQAFGFTEIEFPIARGICTLPVVSFPNSLCALGGRQSHHEVEAGFHESEESDMPKTKYEGCRSEDMEGLVIFFDCVDNS